MSDLMQAVDELDAAQKPYHKAVCALDGCGREVIAKGWCQLHYHRVMRTGEPGGVNPERRRTSDAPEFCTVDGCSRTHYGKGWCQLHWKRVRDHGSTDKPVRKKIRGENHHAWKGGRHPNLRGYIQVSVNDNHPLASMRATEAHYVLEHRLVMAEALGRPLESHETVHHINGVRDDNRLENLQLRIGNHGAGVVMTCRDCGSHNVASSPLAEEKTS